MEVGRPVREKQRETIPPDDPAHRQLRHDHPLEEPQKNHHTILEQQMSRAEEDLRRPALALFLSGLTAGLDLGFGPFAMATSTTLLAGVWPRPVIKLLNANLYAIGFVFVMMGHSALFTEQTTSAVQPVLAGRTSVRRLLRLWGLVLGANVLGATLFSAFAATLGPAAGIIDPEAFGELARELVEKPGWVMLGSAIAAGWLMGLLSWLVTAARDTMSQLVLVWLTTMAIGLGSLHHSIAGTVEVLMGVFVGQGATLADFWRFLVVAVIGNAIGGVVFVAALKFGHTKASVQH